MKNRKNSRDDNITRSRGSSQSRNDLISLSDYDTWERQVLDRLSSPKPIGQVMVQPPFMGGLVFVVDAEVSDTGEGGPAFVAPATGDGRTDRTDALASSPESGPTRHYTFDTGFHQMTLPGTDRTTEAATTNNERSFRLSSKERLASRLNGSFGLRLPRWKAHTTISIPIAPTPDAATLYGSDVKKMTAPAYRKVACALLKTYEDACKTHLGISPKTIANNAHCKAEMIAWLKSVQRHISPTTSIRVRLVYIPYKSNRPLERPYNTRRMVPTTDVYALTNQKYYKRVINGRTRRQPRKNGRRQQEDHRYGYPVNKEDLAGYLAVNVRDDGTIVEGSHTSHVSDERFNYMCYHAGTATANKATRSASTKA